MTEEASDKLPSPYEWFGEDELARQSGVARLVDLFYDEMAQNPAYERIRKLHPSDLSHSREKFFLFLSGWLGGPDLYQPQFGHPRLRARHMPFPISSVDRDQWLACMLTALRAMGFNEKQVETLMVSFFRTADWMRNQPDQADQGQSKPMTLRGV